MPASSAGKEPRPRQAGESERIRASMLKWRAMDEPARRLGRGLGRDELLGRVARDVGATLRRVRAALRREGARSP